MTDGRTFAVLGTIFAMAGLITSQIGWLNHDAYETAGGACMILFAGVMVLLSFRDSR